MEIFLDLSFSIDYQIYAVAKSSFNQFQLIAQLNPYLDMKSLATVVRMLVILKADYCNALYIMLSLKTGQKLQEIQTVEDRFNTGTSKLNNISPAFIGSLLVELS